MTHDNIRDFLGRYIGQKIMDITQQDPDEFAENKETRVYFHMQDGDMISFPIGDDGFTIHEMETSDDDDATHD
jgi:hypothetical protein